MKIGIGVTIAALLFMAVGMFATPASAELSIWDRIAQVAGQILGNRLSDRVDSMPDATIFGAVSGPSVDFPSWTVNGVETFYYTAGLNKASTTLCSFKSPTATSTLDFASIKITTGTTTSGVIEIGKSNTVAYDATTTSLGKTVAGAITQLTLLASTTPEALGGVSATDSANVFAPNTWLVFKYGVAETGTTNVFVGSCKAIFIEN